MTIYHEIMIVFSLVFFSRIIEKFVLKRPSFILQLWLLPYGYYFILFEAYINVAVNGNYNYFFIYYVFVVLWGINGLYKIIFYYNEAYLHDKRNEYIDKIIEQRLSDQRKVE